jgi:hypothetical protein
MKILRYIAFFTVVSVSLMAATLDLGNSVYYSDEGKINIAADARIIVRNMDSPYVMFYLYMHVDEGVSADVHRDEVVLVHQDMEYNMPSLVELRKNYNGDNWDMEMYSRLGSEPLVFSDVKFYKYNYNNDFFPGTNSGILAAEHGYMRGVLGFNTKAYFKNPGFKSGDIVYIRVRDKKNAEIRGEVAVQLGTAQ